MRRGFLGGLALLCLTSATPATAAPPYVVYEVVRAPRASERAVVTTANGSESALTMTALLMPDRGGYTIQAAGLLQGTGAFEQTVRLRPGERFLVAGYRGQVSARADAPGWSFREVRLGFRVVRPATGDSTPVAAGVERFGHATAPAGPYGSVAFAVVPCEPFGAGTWTLTPRGEQPRESSCPFEPDFDFADSRRARHWDLDADVVGVRSYDLRLAVLDFPPLGRR